MSVQIDDLEQLNREAEESRCSTGNVVHVESNTPHGFRSTDQSLAVYYLWQAGNLRQISSFG